MKHLTNEAIEFIKSDEALKGRIAKALGVSTLSMPRIISSNDLRLSNINVLEMVSKAMNLPVAQIVEKQKPAVTGSH